MNPVSAMNNSRHLNVFLLTVTLALASANIASAQPYRVLKSFNGDGKYPCSGVIVSSNVLYGTTSQGGAGAGTVFKLNTDGSGFSVLKRFNFSDGNGPTAGLLLSGSTLYGTAAEGGPGGSPGYGVVFRINTDGSGYQVLKNFSGSDGSNPSGELILVDGTLYGVTSSGGTYGAGGGVAFKMNPDGSGFSALRSFNASVPRGALVEADGTLYGTTSYGGDSGWGAVYKMNTDGSGFSLLHSFTANSSPYAGLTLSGNTLFGTVGGQYPYGGGVFRVNTDGSGYQGLYGGDSSVASLLLAGDTLFGTTEGSAVSQTYGTIFKVDTNGWDGLGLWWFNGSDGNYSCAPLALSGGTLYGTTYYGGSFNYGVVFSLECLAVTRQPLTQTAEVGSTVRLDAQASSPPWMTPSWMPGLGYQWFLNGTNALPAATNSLLALTNVQTAQAGVYTVVVTNMGLALTGSPALLSVIPPTNRRAVPAIVPSGESGASLHLQYADSPAAVHWSPFADVMLGTGGQFSFDISEPLPMARFYRGWQTNGPPAALGLTLATAIQLSGAIGSSVRLEYINQFGPTDAWVMLATVTLTNTTQLYFDTSAIGQPARLYRIVQLP